MRGFVTGASSGVGEAFARRLAADGWDLDITARREDRLGKLATELSSQHGVQVLVHAADLARADDLQRLAEAVAAAEPDLLVNNAGFAGYREFTVVDPQVVSDLISVHITALSTLTRAAVPAMVARGSGGIVTVSSLLALSGSLPPVPLPHRAMYAAAKSFQMTFMQALAGELAGTGVRALVCCPGLIDTEFHDVAGHDLSGTPFPIMPPEDVVTAALAGLLLGEVVCVPGLDDPQKVEAVSQAQRDLLLTAVRFPLASRYQAP